MPAVAGQTTGATGASGEESIMRGSGAMAICVRSIPEQQCLCTVPAVPRPPALRTHWGQHHMHLSASQA